MLISDCNENYNIFLLGDNDAGKTCLMLQFAEKNFNIYQYQCMLGLDFRTRIHEGEGKLIKFHIWNIARELQVRRSGHFEGNLRLHYRHASVFLIIFNVDNRDSFFSLDDWINQIKCYNKTPFLIIGNKSDLHDKRQVTMEEGIDYALSKGCIYMECSAKDHCLTELVFLTALEEIYRAKKK